MNKTDLRPERGEREGEVEEEGVRKVSFLQFFFLISRTPVILIIAFSLFLTYRISIYYF